MNREIKFRGWNKKHAIMVEVGQIDFLEETIQLGSYEYPIDRVVLMQYTGLRDKNGVEIYEGDIVKVKIRGGYSQHFADIEHIKVVEYDDRKACWKPFDVCHMWMDENGTPKAIEVIGNIHDESEEGSK